MNNIIFLDIENTIIDDLVNCNFIEENCRKISFLIKCMRPTAVHFFTWGWKTKDEVDINIVNSMLVKLGLNPINLGFDCRVFTKDFGVKMAISSGWLNDEDFDRAIEPGMMAEFGISKVSCFTEMVASAVTNTDLDVSCATALCPLTYWLIDDLVEKSEEITWHGGRLKATLMNPKDLLDPELVHIHDLPTDPILGMPHSMNFIPH